VFLEEKLWNYHRGENQNGMDLREDGLDGGMGASEISELC
jgi:hypothetical protein